ncbi:MAG TPA: aminotransferase class I/II-fold pyridoxal phosphate-dependent enzyme [Clostridia bacterium]|nr:aminotransferase class I/II-fold pyridoxal phosphate-dependent enzyme [Clostridia bacterium]
MVSLLKMPKNELESLQNTLRDQYEDFKAKEYNFDMTRGKPSSDQLDLCNEMIKDDSLYNDPKSSNGIDCRNYGVLDGIPECKQLFAELLDVDEKNIIIGGNSSLNLMFDYVSQCMTHGSGDLPWAAQGRIKFACPVPGYDRHFTICEHFGIEIVNVPMLDDGPDMDFLADLVKDSSVKGMFCVPKYSNPEGKTFSDAAVKKLAALKPAAKDFRVIWDNAYCIHDLNATPDNLINIFDACKEYGSEDMFVEFASTSKISFPGSGISVIVASDNNIDAIKKRFFAQTIGYDKLNQLRHARFFKNAQGVRDHMKKHAQILYPKFEAVTSALEKELTGLEIASWNKPNGGYFVSLNAMDGCAKRIVELCKQAGLVLTPAGATYPYKNDPNDSNIRIAPTFPPVEDLKVAVQILCLCMKLAAVEKLLQK